MKLLRGDIIVSAGSALIISASSALLYADFTRKIDAGDLKQIGTITFKREVAQRKYQTQVVWEEVEQNFPVYNNDSIRTSELSEAVIHLNDGTDISVDENSMIMLSTLENAININFEHGSISANRSGISGADISAINIKSMDATVSIDKGNIQLTQLENQELDLTVSEGQAKVKDAKGETLVKVNEKALISSDRQETKIVQLNFSLRTPSPNRYIVSDSPKTEVSFEWGVEGKFRNITWEISSDRTFSRSLRSIRVTGENRISYQLDEGVWFWRISAINQETGKSEFSDTAKFNLLYKKPPRIISPVAEEIVTHTATFNSVSFKWADTDNTSDYTLEISPDKDFTAIVSSVKTTLNGIAVDNINPGRYFCRIKSSLNIGGEVFVKNSIPVPFVIEKAREISPVRLLSPAKGSRIDQDVLKSKGLVLTWGSDPVFTSYDIEIAKNSDFNDIISRDRRTVNFSEITRGLDEGQYYWRVQGNISETEKVPFSEAGNFAVTVKEVLTLVSPSSGEEIKIPADRKDNRIRLLWKKLSLPGTYKVQLADNPEFAKSRIINFSNANEGEISIPESGEYYWRVTLADKKGVEVMRSETGRFTAVVEKPAEVVKTLLVVKAPVQGARIYINSAFRGYSSVSVEVRPELNLNVKITAQNFKEYTATVKVEEGKTYTLAPTMERTKMLERVKWVSSFSSPLSSAPVYYKDRIITCSENGTFTVLNSSGTVIVTKKIASRIESRPVVHENNVYIVDVDGNLYSIEINSGKLNWKVKAGGPLLFRSEPLVTPDSIFLATGFGIVEAYEHSGKKKWSNDLDEAIYNSLQVVGRNLIIATDELKLYAIDSKDGDTVWSTPIDEKVITQAPLIHNKHIYFGCYSGVFYSITADKGKVSWTYNTDGAIYSSPAVYEKNILFGSEDGFIYSLEDTSGKLIWKFKTGGPVKVSPLLAFGNVIVADERTVFALNPGKGTLVWQNSFGSDIKTSPVFAGDTVVLGLTNGDVVSVRNTLIQVVK